MASSGARHNYSGNEMTDIHGQMQDSDSGCKYEDDFTDDNFDEILKTHPAFMKDQPTQEEIDNNPLLQGLQKLKYEDDDGTPDEKALAYKEDGNWHFKRKLYAKAVRAYTEGLNKKCIDRTLNSTLYANRAAANFYLENYGSSIKDSLEALKLEPNKTKSMLRCAQCCAALSKHSEAIIWARQVLAADAQQKMAKEILQKSQHELKVAERNLRKQERQVKLQNIKTKALLNVIRKRRVNLDYKTDIAAGEDLPKNDILILQSLHTENPLQPQVHFEDETVEDLVRNGKLLWPVLLTYPEHKVSEIIEEFSEDHSFRTHLEVMFEHRAPWDTDGIYVPESLEVYHEVGNSGLRFIDSSKSLRHVLSVGEIIVKAGTPMFIILSKLSPFKDVFLSRHDVTW